ncbi:MAG TPA: GNAT family N-acetyltransferase [Microlunatus sp.]|nr:GNAT family N-acetyltransferase [Microlunatus sp.]
MDWYTAAVLTGPRLRLDALRPDDAEAFVAALGDRQAASEVTRHLSYSPPDSLTEARDLIERAIADPGRVAYAQRLREDGRLIGTTSFYDIDPANRGIAIGHTWLGRPWWRTGLNTESKLLLLRHAFETLGVERVAWHTDIANTRSQAAIERLGATREGVLRHHRLRRDGTWRDTVCYALLRGDWLETKHRLLDQVPLAITRDDTTHRWLARFGDTQIGEIDFVPQDDVVFVTHTGTAVDWRRCGIAARLTTAALDDLLQRGLRVRPGCSYTRRFLREHPEYADLVA